MDNMRKLIEQKVEEYYNGGYNCNVGCLNFDRKRNNKPLFIRQWIEDDDGWETKRNPEFDIHKFIDQCDNEELYYVLDNMLCEMYR